MYRLGDGHPHPINALGSHLVAVSDPSRVQVHRDDFSIGTRSMMQLPFLSCCRSWLILAKKVERKLQLLRWGTIIFTFVTFAFPHDDTDAAYYLKRRSRTWHRTSQRPKIIPLPEAVSVIYGNVPFKLCEDQKPKLIFNFFLTTACDELIVQQVAVKSLRMYDSGESKERLSRASPYPVHWSAVPYLTICRSYYTNSKYVRAFNIAIFYLYMATRLVSAHSSP